MLHMDPEFLSQLVGRTINRVIKYKFGQKEPIHFGSLDDKILEWDSLVFDKSIVTLQVFSHDTADEGSEKFNSFWPEYTESGYQIHNKSGITLRDLTEAVYRMQGLEHPWYRARYRGFKINYKWPEAVIITANFHYMK